MLMILTYWPRYLVWSHVLICNCKLLNRIITCVVVSFNVLVFSVGPSCKMIPRAKGLSSSLELNYFVDDHVLREINISLSTVKNRYALIHFRESLSTLNLSVAIMSHFSSDICQSRKKRDYRSWSQHNPVRLLKTVLYLFLRNLTKWSRMCFIVSSNTSEIQCIWHLQFVYEYFFCPFRDQRDDVRNSADDDETDLTQQLRKRCNSVFWDLYPIVKHILQKHVKIYYVVTLNIVLSSHRTRHFRPCPHLIVYVYLVYCVNNR